MRRLKLGSLLALIAACAIAPATASAGERHIVVLQDGADAGAAALYKATNPGASPAQVKSALQSAGTLDWNDGDDPDPIKERLLNVSDF